MPTLAPTLRREVVASWLRVHGPASVERIGREAMGLSGPPTLVAAVVERALVREPSLRRREDGRFEARRRMTQRGGAPVAPCPLRAEDVATLPNTAGVYRFLDADRAVLYVGKAMRLRQRVLTYFVARSDGRRRQPALMRHVAAIAWTETPSELDALLLEVAEIQRLRPRFNVQRRTRARSAGAEDSSAGASNSVAFVPGPDEGCVDVLLLRQGTLVERVTTRRSGGRLTGMRAVRRAMCRTFFDGAGAAAPSPDPVTSRITATWLRRRRRTLNVIAVDDAANRDELARRVRAYLLDPDLFERRIWRA